MRPFGYKADLTTLLLPSFSSSTWLANTIMRPNSSSLFLNTLRKISTYNNPIQYEAAVTCFGAEHSHILAQREEWVDCEHITDIACASKAACQQVEVDKRH